MKTAMGSKQTVQRNWVVIDVKDKVLGRAATTIASVLRGKHKPIFTPHADCGDFVVVVNADKVRLTGKKWQDKKYIHHTGYPGGATTESFKELMKTDPQRVFMRAVKGMIPHNRLGARVIRKLKVYAGSSHPHAAQKPEPLNV